jgi:hypothetical protein
MRDHGPSLGLVLALTQNRRVARTANPNCLALVGVDRVGPRATGLILLLLAFFAFRVMKNNYFLA